jgi:hypothetical protein
VLTASVADMDVEEAVRRVAAIADALPETLEQDAWVGVRWRIRTHTFAHVYPVGDDKPAGSAEILGTREPLVVMTFRAPADEAATFERLGPPWFKPPWSATVVGLRLDDDTDWEEVAELVTDSYCLRAPRKLARVVEQRIDESGVPPGSKHPRA